MGITKYKWSEMFLGSSKYIRVGGIMVKDGIPMVSVIIPVYNVEKYLARCLDSVLRQTYENYEIICVDDCSPDNSKEILKRYRSKYGDKMIVLHNEQNMGLGKTRERGIEASNGEYLIFIDSDDYIKRDYISTYINAVLKKSYDVVIGGYIKDIDGRLFEHKVEDSFWSLVTYAIACAKMFKKSFIVEHQVKFSKIRCGEDIFFSMCLFCERPSFLVLDYAGYYYYFNRESITGTLNHNKEYECFVVSIFEEFMQEYKMQILSDTQKRVIEYNYVADMINSLITYGHGCGVRKMKQKYNYFITDLKQRFPDYKNNPYFGLFKPKGQTLKIRTGVGIVMGLHKIHLDWLLFDFIALM